MNRNPNVEGISKYAKEKSEIAYQKAEKVIKELLKGQEMINFNHVSNKSGVSKSFLYNHSELRNRIEHLRTQQIGLDSTKQLKRRTTGTSKDVIIASLKNKNEQLVKENKELKSQLQRYLSKVYNEI